MQDIQLVPLSTPEFFCPGRESYPIGAEVIIYETSWISHTLNAVVVYVGSRKIQQQAEEYYGSGNIIRLHKAQRGVSDLKFRVLYVLQKEEIPDRYEIENKYIQKYWEFYGRRICVNQRLNSGQGYWTPEMKEKFRQTSQERFGTDHPFQAEEVKAKIKATHNKDLGVDFPMQASAVREKSKQACIQKYGADNISQVESIKQKKKDTYTKHFGGVGFASKEIRQKVLQEFGEGITNVSQVPEVQQKIKNSIQSRYTNPTAKTKHSRAVQQLDLSSGEVIQEFWSGAAAAIAIYPEQFRQAKIGICSACKGRLKSYKGFGWKYA